MSDLVFTKDGWDDYTYWQGQDKKTLRRINDLLKDIDREPFEGMGKPEPLRGNLSGKWSRRINDADRLVYKFESDKITIYQCRSHYSNNN
jgi:toxin YoeB